MLHLYLTVETLCVCKTHQTSVYHNYLFNYLNVLIFFWQEETKWLSLNYRNASEIPCIICWLKGVDVLGSAEICLDKLSDTYVGFCRGERISHVITWDGTLSKFFPSILLMCLRACEVIWCLSRKENWQPSRMQWKWLLTWLYLQPAEKNRDCDRLQAHWWGFVLPPETNALWPSSLFLAM